MAQLNDPIHLLPEQTATATNDTSSLQSNAVSSAPQYKSNQKSNASTRKQASNQYRQKNYHNRSRNNYYSNNNNNYNNNYDENYYEQTEEDYYSNQNSYYVNNNINSAYFNNNNSNININNSSRQNKRGPSQSQHQSQQNRLNFSINNNQQSYSNSNISNYDSQHFNERDTQESHYPINNNPNNSSYSNAKSKQSNQFNSNRSNSQIQNENNNHTNPTQIKRNKQNRNKQFKANAPNHDQRKQHENNMDTIYSSASSQQRPSSSQSAESKTNKNHQSTESKTNKNHQSKQKSATQNKQFETRSEILIDQLMKFQLECMVCCHKIKDDKSIWSCNICFHIFHLYCIKKWANSPAAKVDDENLNKWRCPGCQSTHEQIPSKYTCFCGKKINPDLSKHEENKPYHLRQLPHSCGQICGKSLAKSNTLDQISNKTLICKHTCVIPCHPGPCQTCDALVTRTCNCGKAKFQVKCSSLKLPVCDTTCGQSLNCSKHICEQICHSGECQPCSVDIDQSCYSHDVKRVVKCGSPLVTPDSRFSCDKKCGKLLACGKHTCESLCHSADCPACPLLPSKLTNCPCGKTGVKELLLKNKIIRTTCTDPIPTCDKICNKLLHVVDGTGETDLHFCESKCHLGECPACQKQIEIKCRCGKETEQVICSRQPVIKLCSKRCNKKRLCGRHQCNEICCNDRDHFCTIVCSRLLDCGQHKCEQLCHKGPCQRCLVASFDERVCECGRTVQYPPIRCGTKRLDCPHTCTRVHECNHPITHSCHWEAKCPPCSFLTSKMCMGNHELRHNIPCFMKDVSCGRLCDKQLSGCSHKCNKICHKEDNCLAENEKCMQLCNKERPHCEHVCGEPCHGTDPCPDTICQALIQVKCKCGLKTKQIKCQQRMYEPASSIVFENLASELKEMLSCRTIDITTFRNMEILKKKHELPCEEECFLAERNKNLAQALQIDPNFKAKVIYSDFLKNYAREDPNFVVEIEKKLESFVKEAKLNTKVTKKYFNLPVMKSYERRMIHELAPYYGFETMSQDPEPFRNVCLIASKDKCCLPSPSLMQSIEVKSKQSAMPRINFKTVTGPIQTNLKVLQPAESDFLPVSSAFASLNDESEQIVAETVSKEKEIDYFDITD